MMKIFRLVSLLNRVWIVHALLLALLAACSNSVMEEPQEAQEPQEPQDAETPADTVLPEVPAFALVEVDSVHSEMMRVSPNGAMAILGSDGPLAKANEKPRMRVKLDYDFALGEHDILCAPRLVSHLDICLFFLYRHFDVYYRFLYIHPQHDPRLTVCHLTVAILQYQLLTKRRQVQWLRQMNAETSQFQQRIVFVETTATTQIEQHIALLHPDVHTHIATTAGHRL